MFILTTEDEDGMLQADIEAFDTRDDAKKRAVELMPALLKGNSLAIYKCTLVEALETNS